MAKQQTLKQRLRPLLSGAVALEDLDPHTRQALDIYIAFRASALTDLPPDQIKAEINKMPEPVRELIRNKARAIYKHKFLDQARQ